jgi:hypothetical protein
MLLKGWKIFIFVLVFELMKSRYDQSKLYIETLIEVFPSSIELWIELLLNPGLSQNIPEVNFREEFFNISFTLFSRLSNVLPKQPEYILNLSIHWYIN